MRTFLKLILILSVAAALMMFGARGAAVDGVPEYIISSDGGEYVISALGGTAAVPLMRTSRFSEVCEYISASSGTGVSLFFDGVTVDGGAVTFPAGKYTLSGELTLTGGVLEIDGADVTMRDITLRASGGVRVKSGELTLASGEISSDGGTAVLLDYAAAALFRMTGGSVTSASTAAAVHISNGTAEITGGGIKNSIGAAIYNSSTLMLSGSPVICGGDYGILTDAPVTLSSGTSRYSGSVTVKYGKLFKEGSISCVFYSAAEASVGGIRLFDINGEEKDLRCFSSYQGIAEKNFAAVYLPYSVRYFVGGAVVKADELTCGMLASSYTAPDREGYEFVGWSVGEGGALCDFAVPVTESLDLYAKYRLTPPTFSLTSLEFTFDGAEHFLTVCDVAHPLLEGALVNYVWYKDGIQISNGSPSLSVRRVSDSGSYSCRLVLTYGSDSAEITTPQVKVRVDKACIPLPAVSPKYYSGAYLTSGLPDTSFYSVTENGGVGVGIYPVKLSVKDPENCAFPSGSATAYVDFEILRAENAWTEELRISDVYEGSAPSPTAFSLFGRVEYYFSDSENGAYTQATPTSHGTYYCVARVAECGDYTGLSSPAIPFSVIEEKLTGISIAAMPTRCDYTAFESFSGDGLLLSVTFNSSRTETVGADKLTFTYQTADAFRWGDSAVIASYLDLSVAVPVNVARAKYDLTGIGFSDASFVFDGTEKSISRTGELPVGKDGIPLTAEIIGGGKNSGRYTVVLIFSTESKNYDLPSALSATLTVTPRECEAVFGDLSFVYDGTLKCPTAFYTDIYGRRISLAVSGARSLAGKHIAVAAASDPNYIITGASAEYEIAKADYDMSGVFWSCDGFTYDGGEKSVSLSGLPSGVTVAGYADAKGVKAGLYTARAVLRYDAQNYNPPPELSHEWQIYKADYVLDGFSFTDAAPTFDGEVHYPVFSGTMPVGVDGIPLSYSFDRGASRVCDGRVAVTVTFFTVSTNYNAPSPLTVYVEILPCEICVTWSDLEFVYDTYPHSPTASCAECEVRVLGGGVDAGSYTATAVPLNSDYRIINSSVSYTVARSVNLWIIPLTVSDTFVGTPPSPAAKSAGGAAVYRYYSKNGELLDGIPSAAGEYFVEAFTEGDNNYEPLVSGRVKFSLIAIAPVAIRAELLAEGLTAFGTLSGTDLAVTVTNNDGSEFIADGGEITVTYRTAGSLRFGDGYVTVSCCGFDVRLPVEVKKADYDMSAVRWSESRFVYDGTEKSVSLLGLPDGVTVASYTGGRGTLAGEYPVSATLSYDAENYNMPRVADGLLTVEKRKVAVPQIPPLVYNGSYQSPTLPDSTEYTARASRGRDAGKYTVVFTLRDGENFAFEDGGAETVAEYTVLPREITLRLSDVDKYLMSKMPAPDFTVIDGELAEGDSLKLVFSYGDSIVTCSSADKNYSLTVLTGRIIRHNRPSDSTLFLLFLIFLILLTLALLAVIAVRRRQAIAHCIAVIKCRLSPIARRTPETEETEEPCTAEPEPPQDEALAVNVERADSLITDSLAKDLVRKDGVRIYTSGSKKRIVNVDTLSENFSCGDTVDVNRLKEMSLIPYDTAYIKVLARGMIDKPLKVYANDFSLSAVKMIALTGGEAVRSITVKCKEPPPPDDNFNEKT